jgi:hypothetical protein
MGRGATLTERGASMLCAICRRPLWDDARPIEHDDPASAVAHPVHRGCARRRARLERELELAARKGRTQLSSRPQERGAAALGGAAVPPPKGACP